MKTKIFLLGCVLLVIAAVAVALGLTLVESDEKSDDPVPLPEPPISAVEAISPEFWTEEELELYKEFNTGLLYEEAFVATAYGPHAAIIVENSNALGTHIGTKVLEANGTAADAAIAAAASNIVLRHSAFVSFAGIMHLVYFDAAKNETKVIHGHYNTVPENDPTDIQSPDYPVGAQTGIPAFFAVADTLIDTYGSGLFTLGDLLAPSVWLAENGLYNEGIVFEASKERTRLVLNLDDPGKRARLSSSARASSHASQCQYLWN